MPLGCKIWLECTPKVSKSSNFVSFLPSLSMFFIKNTPKVSLKLRDSQKLKGARKPNLERWRKIKGTRKLMVLRAKMRQLCNISWTENDGLFKLFDGIWLTDIFWRSLHIDYDCLENGSKFHRFHGIYDAATAKKTPLSCFTSFISFTRFMMQPQLKRPL